MLNEERKDDIVYLFRYINKIIGADLDKRLAEYGLTGVQGRILLFISKTNNIDKCEVHQNDIENAFNLSKSTVSGIVRRLEKNGFITVEKQHPYAILKESDKGKDAVHYVLNHRAQFAEELFKDVSEKEKESLKNALLKLINNMEGGNKDVEKD